MDERMIQQAAHVFADAVDAFIEAQGMIAKNEILKSRGHEIEFGKDSFDHLRDRMQNQIAGEYHR